MVRTFVVRQATDLKALSTTLLDGRFRGEQADAAIDQLKAINPHVDLDKLRAGTVLLVPDVPGFKTTPAETAPSTPLDDVRDLLNDALSGAVKANRESSAAGAAERADVAAVLKSAAFKRLADSDQDLAQRADEAQKALAADEKSDKEADEMLTGIGKAALAELALVTKLLG